METNILPETTLIDTHAHLHAIDAPVEYQGKISKPADLIDTLRALSRVKDRPTEVLARITTENADRFFCFVKQLVSHLD